jgi:hypothetical protein
MKPGKPGIEAASKASHKVKHTSPYGPLTGERADARIGPGPDRPAAQGIVDGTLTTRHLGK